MAQACEGCLTFVSLTSGAQGRSPLSPSNQGPRKKWDPETFYRKLFDGREGDGTYTDEDVMALAARAAAYASIAKRGPLALIPKPGMGAELAKRFVNVGKFTGEARIFFSVDEAMAWLEAQPEGKPLPEDKR